MGKKNVLSDYLKRPFFIGLISFVFWGIAIYLAYRGFSSVFSGNYIYLNFIPFELSNFSDMVGEAVLVFIISLSIFVIGFGVWNGMRGRRKVAILLSFLLIVYNLWIMFNMKFILSLNSDYVLISSLIFSIFTFCYLLFSRKGREHFGK